MSDKHRTPGTHKKPLPYNEEDGRELFDNLFAVASTTECTGLIPAVPGGEPEETASYSDIYDVPLANEKKPETTPKKKT